MPEFLELPPGDLLVDRNLRTDVGLTKEFTDSVKQHGVLVPVVAVEVAEGYRVRHGHRRVAAALKAKLPYIAVFVIGHEDDVNVDRILHQWAENEHRIGLTLADRVRAVEQLAAFGMPAAAIAKRTGSPRGDVDQALAVARSELAAAAAGRYEFLDLGQAAAVAEFEADTEAVKRLVAAAKTGEFDHVVTRMRQDRDQEANVGACVARLQAAGVAVIGIDVDRDVLARYWMADAKPARVNALQATQPAGVPLGDSMTDEEHASCPHRAALVEAVTWRPEGFDVATYCLDWRAAGHEKRYREDPPEARASRAAEAAADPEEEARWATEAAAQAERAAAWAAADEVRAAYVRGLLARAKPDKALQQPLLAFLVLELTDADCYFEVDMIGAAERAGKLEPAPDADDGQPDWRRRDERVGEASIALRAMHPELAILAAILEGGEAAMAGRSPHPTTARYLEFLVLAGYVLAGCEAELLERARAAAVEEPTDG